MTTAKNGSKTGPAFEAQKGKGRPKGVLNKNTKALKEMILAALDNKGGVRYLERQADENPVAFMSLVGKVLPMTVANDSPEGFKLTIVSGVPRGND